jgi:hypothetical protein
VVLPLGLRALLRRVADAGDHGGHAGQDRDPVGESTDVGGVGAELVDELVLGVVGRAVGVDDRVEQAEQASGRRCEGQRRRRVDACGDEVPVLVEPDGDPSEPLAQAEPVELQQLDQLRPAVDRTGRRRRVAEEAFEQIGPAVLVGEVALELVEHAEPRRQAGGDGELVEDPARERVERADRRMVERIERRLVALLVEQVGGGVARALQFVAEAAPEVGRGLLREGDGGDRSDLGAGAHQAQDAADQARRLAGTGTGLDEEVGVEVVANPVAVGSVGGFEP